jgi:hypothetical protein
MSFAYSGVKPEQPRTGDDALIHGLLEPDVGVAGAFGAEVAERREAGHQRGSQVIHCPRCAERQRFVEHLVVP